MEIFIMRSIWFATGLTLAICGSSFANPPSPERGAGYDFPVIGRYAGSGFVPAENQRSQACKVYADRVEIDESWGFVHTHRVMLANVELASLAMLIQSAAQAPVHRTLAPTDIPFTSYFGALTADGDVTIRSYDGSSISTRDSTEAEALMAMLDGLCGQGFADR